MKKIIKIYLSFLILIFSLGGLSYSAPLNIEDLVDNFQWGTDLQRDQIAKDNLGREISASGRVSNVGEYDFFDITNDIKGIYYQVSLEEQKTENNVPYQVIFLFKDRDKVKDINRGESFQRDGKVIRIMDERLQIAVWIFCGELGEKDKALFKQD